MGHFDGDHGRRHDFEHFTAKDDSEENSDEDPGCIIENRQGLSVENLGTVARSPFVLWSRLTQRTLAQC